MAEPVGGETLTLEPGDFAWALGKGDLWWPARIRSPSDLPAKVSMDRPSNSPAALYLSCFGDGGSAWHDNPSSTLAPFLPTSFPSQTSPSKAFSRALSSAATAFSRCLESHLIFCCTPAAKFKTNAPVSITNVVANATPEEILNGLRGFAVDVSSGTSLDVAVSRAWVSAFARGTGTRHVPLTEFAVHRGIPQERSEEGGGVEGRRKAKMKRRSMAELMAGLDSEMDGEGSTIAEEDGDWKGANDGVCSGRRERKKSKYLSPPYTLVNLKGRVIWGKSSEKKMGMENCEGEDGGSEKVNRGARQRVGLYWEDKDFVLDEKGTSVSDLVMEMRLVALDVLSLEESDEFDREIRGFFGKYRRMVYGGADDEVVGKDDKEDKLVKEKLPTAANGSAGDKQTMKKKKSIGGIIGKDAQEPKSSRHKRVLGSTEEADGLGGEKSVQKRKKKEDVVSCGKNDDPQVVGVVKHGDASGGGKTANKKKKNRRMKEEAKDAKKGNRRKKEEANVAKKGNRRKRNEANDAKKGNRRKKEDANVHELVRPIENGGMDANRSKSAKKGGEKEQQGDMDADRGKSVKKGDEEEEQGDTDAGSREGKSNKKTADGKEKEMNGDLASVLAVPVILEASGNKEGAPTVVMGLGTNGLQEGTSTKKATIKRKVAARAHVNVGEANGEGKPQQKWQRRKEGTDMSSGEGGSGRPKQREEKDEEVDSDNGAAILLSFLKGVNIPSKEELISTYSRYGTLRESEMVLMKECSSARVVFARKSDAEKALHCEDRDRSSEASCQIRYLHGDSNVPTPPQSAAGAGAASSTPKPPLEYVKKSLESMITTLAASGVPIGGLLDGKARPESKENLVDEMSGLLKKVNSLLNAGPSSGSTSGAAT